VFPQELLERDRWIRHKAKRPLHPQGYWISVTHPDSWSSYSTAKASKFGDGLGFVLNGDGIVCIDLDHCYDGAPTAEALALIESLPNTYIEISPSGTGLHIWGLAKMDSGKRFNRNGQSVEIYPAGRFITMTGKAITRVPLAQLPIDTLVQG
jgi:primase-polymerase (primpol)-like protein